MISKGCVVAGYLFLRDIARLNRRFDLFLGFYFTEIISNRIKLAAV